MKYNYVWIGIFLMVVQSYGMNRLKPDIALVRPELREFVGTIMVRLQAEKTKEAIEITKTISFDLHGSNSINEIFVIDTNHNTKFIRFDAKQYTIGQTMSEHDQAACIAMINALLPKIRR